MAAKDRKFTRLAAEVCGYLERLDAGLCPTCGGEIKKELFNDIELAEFKITGICKSCQDRIFEAGNG